MRRIVPLVLAAAAALAGLPAVAASAAPQAAVSGTAHGRGGFTAVQPTRLLDTRTGNGGHLGKVGPGESVDVLVAGRGGVPALGVAAVVVTVTVTEPSMPTYVTAYPTGAPRPHASTVNTVAGATSAGATTVGVGGGSVTLYNASGTAHLVLDVSGWYADDAGTGAKYLAHAPARVADTRHSQAMGDGETRTFDIGTPVRLPSYATAVALNVTVTRPSSEGFLTVYRTGDARPLASNVNFRAGQTVANYVVTGVGTGVNGGRIDVFNSRGSTHVVVDVVGYYGKEVNSRFVPVVPARVLDTRGRYKVALAPGEERELDLTGVAGIPARLPAAVALTLTVTQPTEKTYLTIYPADQPRPTASTLNASPGESRANHAVTAVDAGGLVRIYNASGFSHVVVDVVGWFDRPVFTVGQLGTSGSVEYGGNAITPADVVFDPWSAFAYVTNTAEDRVEVLDLDTGRLRTPIPVGDFPTGIDMTADGQLLYVANRGGTTVSEIDVETRLELRRIPIVPGGSDDRPYSLAVLANGHVLVATTFSGSGFGARMFELDPATSVVKYRSDFWYSGTTTERTELQASGDRRAVAITAGDISSGPVFRYDLDTDTFTPQTVTDRFTSHVGINHDGSVLAVNAGLMFFDGTMQKIGSVPAAEYGAGVALSADGETSYSLHGATLVISDVPSLSVVDGINVFAHATNYSYLNNHRLLVTPDETALVGLTSRGITFVRL